MTDAPGWPGIPPRWTSSAKSGVGTALSDLSRVWFTLSHGILDEIYYPRVDQACTRDFGLIVTDGAGFFAEEKRDCSFELTRLEDGVPAFQLVNTHTGGRFRIIKDVLTDQRADAVIQRIRLEVLSGPPLRLFALLAPHLVNGGSAQHRLDRQLQGASHDVCRGRRHASRARLLADALVCRSVGFVGASDGWQMLPRRTARADRGVRSRRRRQRRADTEKLPCRNTRVPCSLWASGRIVAEAAYPRACQFADAIRCRR